MKESRNLLLWIGIGILGLITFYPLFQVGIVTGDDLVYMLWPFDHFASDAKAYAEATGRFYFYIALWVYKIPYLIDSSIYFHSMLILPIMGSFILFIGLIKRIFKSESAALISALIACSVFQICGGHSATAAYPFYFSFTFSLLLISLHLLLSYTRKGKYYYLVLSSIIFAFTTIFYESYLIFYILVFICIICRYPFRDIFKRQNFLRITKELGPFIFWGIAYLIVYYLFYKSCPAQYGGNTFSSHFEFSLFAKAMGNMAFYALPLSSLFDYQFFITEYSLATKQTVHLLSLIFTQAGIVAYIKAIITVIIGIIIFRHQKIEVSNWKLLKIGCIGILFIFLPHLPLALSEKYTTAIQNTYVTTYFAFFAVVLFLYTFAMYIFNLLSEKKWAQKIVFIFLGIALFFVTLSTQFVNERVAQDLAVAEKRLLIMEKMLISATIPDGSEVYVEQLHQSASYFAIPITRQQYPFSLFAKEKNGLEMYQHLDYSEFYKKFKNQKETIYMIYFSQSSKTGDCQMLIVSSRGDQLQEQFSENRCDSMIVGYLSIYKSFSISFASDSITDIFISEKPSQSQGNFHYANLAFHSKPEVSIFNVKGDRINPSTFMISNQLFQNTSKITFGSYPKGYENRWVKHIMRDLQKNQEFVKSIEQKAQGHGISYQEALRNDARWLIYNDFQ